MPRVKNKFAFALSPTLSIAGDGIPDWWKVLKGLDPFAGNLDAVSSFGDGLTDLQEFQASLTVFNGTLSGFTGNTAVRYGLFRSSTTIGFIAVPGSFTTGDLTFPYLPVPQYAVIDLGPGNVVDMNDEGDVRVSDSTNGTMSLWSQGNLSSLPMSDPDDSNIIYGWSSLAADGTVQGSFYGVNGEDDFGPMRWNPTDGLSYRGYVEDFSGYLPENYDYDAPAIWAEPMANFATRDGNCYYGILYERYDYVGEYEDGDGDEVPVIPANWEFMMFEWSADGTLSVLTDPLPFRGWYPDSYAPPSAPQMSFVQATTPQGDTLEVEMDAAFTEDPDNTAGPGFPYWELTGDNYGFTGYLNGIALPSDVSVDAPIANIDTRAVIVDNYGSNTLYYQSGDSLVPANLTANSSSTTPLNYINALSSLGTAVTADGHLWLNGQQLNPTDYFPLRDFNTDLSFNLTAMGIGATIANPAFQAVASSGNSQVVAGQFYNDTDPEAVVIAPSSLAVDNNRDGIITFNGTDATTQGDPFRFWLNDDIDALTEMDGIYPVQDDLDPTSGNVDWTRDTIPCTRDLEDHARIWVNVGSNEAQFASGNMAVGLKWVGGNFSGNNTPTIKLFIAADTDGGTGYLTDNTTANAQVTGNYGNATINADPAVTTNTTLIQANTGNTAWDFIIPASALGNLTASGGIAHFIFEACHAGTGELTVVLLKKSGSTYAAMTTPGAGVYFDLEDIKQFYERYTVGQGNPTVGNETVNTMMLPAKTALPSTEGLASGVSPFRYDAVHPGLSVSNDVNGNKYILFVHGSDLPPWDRDAFAETMFKRLYWQGYKGKFGAYQWPTTYASDDLHEIFATDRSEFVAWKSAQPLTDLLHTTLKYGSGNIYLMSHSQGNILVGEALRLGAQQGTGYLASTYIPTQAAVAGETYDPSLESTEALAFSRGFPTSLIDFTVLKTPGIHENWFTSSNTTVTSKVNFENVNDYALSYGIWQLDQVAKPDQRSSYATWDDTNTFEYKAPYGYTGNLTAPVFDDSGNYFSKSIWTDEPTGPYGVPTLTINGTKPLALATNTTSRSGDMNDQYEIMAFAAQPRSKAIGATPSSVGVSGFSSVDLSSVWPADTYTDDPTKPYKDHPWHSAEFNFDNMSQHSYWGELILKFGMTPLNP